MIYCCLRSANPFPVRREATDESVHPRQLQHTPGLREDFPIPTPADNEMLVRVRASSVNGADGAIAAGMLSGMVDH